MTHDSKTSPHVARTSRVAFGMVDSSVIRDETLPPMAKLVYTYLATYCSDVRSAFPSRARIARELGISVRTVDAAVKAAEQAGLFEVTRRKSKDKRVNHTNLYLLHDLGGGYVVGSGAVGGGAAVAPPGAGVAPKQDQSSTPEKDSSLMRHHADARRRHTESRKRRRDELPADRSWLTYDNDGLEENIIDHVDEVYGVGPGVDAMVYSMCEEQRYADRKRQKPPLYVLNTALKAAREGLGITDERIPA